MKALGFDWRRDVPIVAAAILCAGIGVRYVTTLDRLPFWGDESGWIGKSLGWFLLMRGDFDDGFWSGEALDQPMGAPYAFGIVAQMGGTTKDTLNKMYDFQKSYAENRKEGRVPGDGLLWRCRVFSALCGIVGIGAAVVIVWRLTGPAGGLATAVLLGLNPHYIRWVQRAMSDGMLSMWLLASWALCLILADALQQRCYGRAWRWSLLLGVTAGLGMMTKLTALTVPLCIVVAVVVEAYVAVRSRSSSRSVRRWRMPVAAGAMALMVGFGLFVVQSPTTWRNPPAGIRAMIEWRRAVIKQQQQSLPEYAIHGQWDRLGMMTSRVWHDFGVFSSWGVSEIPGLAWLDGWLFLAGLCCLFIRQRRARLNGDVAQWQCVIITWVWVAVMVLSCAVLLPYDHDRYYLTAFLASTLIQGVFVGAVAGYIGGWLLRFRSGGCDGGVRPPSQGHGASAGGS